jgi:hypothetical protein
MSKTVEVTKQPSKYITVTQTKNTQTVVQPLEQVLEVHDRGVAGPQGPAGVDGVGFDPAVIPSLVSYRHNQNAVSDFWTITHNLGFLPNVTVFNSADGMVEGNVVHTSINSLTIDFSASFSGYAVLS